MAVTPERLWAELSDAWTFTGWVVGASHIRGVDGSWPAVGARLHHQVGVWPLVVSDSTAVIESDPPRRLVLQARAWPAGEARVELTVTADGTGSMVRMAEWPTHGPGRWLHNPLQDALLRRRNIESLQRLADIAQNRSDPRLRGTQRGLDQPA
ncbi:MAG: polyketide cyclase [Pseudonocardiales bacterium]|nr:MAG: polyketide cyclase [Pseudonocardiales bacterium]